MSSIDVRAVPVPERLAVPSRGARRRRWEMTILRVLGGFALTGFFLALSALVLVLSGIYGFLEFAKLY